jgi:hypothetical protein
MIYKLCKSVGKIGIEKRRNKLQSFLFLKMAEDPTDQSSLQNQTSPPNGQNQQTNIMAKIHYFDPQNYNEVVEVLVEVFGFILGEIIKSPEPLDQQKMGAMLNTYIANCMQKGQAVTEQPPLNSTCEHIFVKGSTPGRICARPAKHIGIEGLPKCSQHKNSKPSKTTAGKGSSTKPTGGTEQAFSYSAYQNKGKVAPQSLTTIQASIAEQTAAPKLSLSQAPDGRIYNPATNFLFEQRPEGWIAYGVMEGEKTVKLSAKDVYVCFGNKWKWDPACVEDEAAESMAHPLVIGADHPLVSSQSGLIRSKIDSVRANNN